MTRDLQLALRAKRAGAKYSLRIVREARRAGIPISLGFALIQQESGFRNVFGHDPTSSIPDSWKGGRVTKGRYAHYRAFRATKGMQGVGPAQLTWWEYQDRADALGGCWKPAINIRVAFAHLADLIDTYGLVVGLRRYNGTGRAAIEYSRSVRERMAHWHRVLT